jgi:hypothetical protein
MREKQNIGWWSFVRFTVKFMSSAKDGNPVEATVDWRGVESKNAFT